MHTRAPHGFTLIETLAALFLLTLTLLLGLGLVLQHPRIVRRLDAQREALHTMEATLEALRAGALPLASQDLPPVGRHRMALSVRIAPAGDPPGLYRVEVRARYLVEGQPRERTVESLLWRPSAP
jgi:prepilin-type N-terminal cleavage/methylation domain-containing protein